jgi:hypothetical protein
LRRRDPITAFAQRPSAGTAGQNLDVRRKRIVGDILSNRAQLVSAFVLRNAQKRRAAARRDRGRACVTFWIWRDRKADIRTSGAARIIDRQPILSRNERKRAARVRVQRKIGGVLAKIKIGRSLPAIRDRAIGMRDADLKIAVHGIDIAPIVDADAIVLTDLKTIPFQIRRRAAAARVIRASERNEVIGTRSFVNADDCIKGRRARSRWHDGDFMGRRNGGELEPNIFQRRGTRKIIA